MEEAHRWSELMAGIDIERMLMDTRIIAREERLSGSPAERRAFEYIAQELEKVGAVTRWYEPEALISLPVRASLRLAGLDEAFPCITHSFSAATAPDGLVAKAVLVGKGSPEDYEGVDVRGRIAVISGLAHPVKVALAEERGALGEVFLNRDPYPHNMILSPVWGSPDRDQVGKLPRTPVVTVAGAAAERLQTLAETGEVRLSLVTVVDTGWRPIPVMTADLLGEAEDSFVLLSGHVDSWHQGAMDNGTANAAQLEIARLLAARPRYRGLRLAFWSGHSHGRYAGSAWYADQFWPELAEHCAVHINVDSLGGRGADHITDAFALPETEAVATEVLAALTGEKFVGTRPGRSGDQSFFGIGIPSLFMTVSEHPASSPGFSRDSSVAGNLGWWWHTIEDTIDKIDPSNLRRDTAIYLGCVSEYCLSPVLPLDYALAAAELAGLVDRRQELIARADLAVDLEGLVADTAELVEKCGELEEFRRSLAGSIADKEIVSRLNRILLDLGRVLIPVLYTRSGRFTHDPATTLAPLPPLAMADDLDRYQGREDLLQRAVELRRGANRVRQATRSALRLVKGALADLNALGR